MMALTASYPGRPTGSGAWVASTSKDVRRAGRGEGCGTSIVASPAFPSSCASVETGAEIKAGAISGASGNTARCV